MTDATIAATGLTDVGRVREANEDAYYVGTNLVAVADGMGGHLAGEVASATALEPVRALEGSRFDDGHTAVTALRDAVVQANDTVSQMAEDDPAFRGMGTTLTAAIVEGRRVHLAHVGDSRAYLLRGDRFSQLTDDHTLVQHLVDEGQITPEEAATHPQRSIITRAIGVSRDIDVDTISLELDPGDQLLLCSDGLTGVISDDDIASELAKGDDADATLERLVEMANRGGGPDNITAVLLRYGDHPPEVGGAGSEEGEEPGEDTSPSRGPDGTGGSRAPVLIGTRSDGQGGDWARRLGNYGALSPTGGGAGPVDDDGGGRARRRAGRALGVLAVVAVLIGAIALGGRFLLDRSYYVGLDGDQVVIYRGVDLTLGPLELGRVFERSDLTVDEVPSWYADALEGGVAAADLGDAQRIIENAPRRAVDDEAADGAGGADAGGTDAGATDGGGAADPDGDDPDGDDPNAATRSVAPGPWS
jgi:PPM family protein phosphatase